MSNPEGPDHLCSAATSPKWRETAHSSISNTQPFRLGRNTPTQFHYVATYVRLPFAGQAQEV